MSISFNDMFTQLDEAWPLASYPFLAVLPTSEVIMMVGSLVALYTISPSTFSLAFSRNLPMRPDGIPWTYPQTGVATLLPLDPADNYAVKVRFAQMILLGQTCCSILRSSSDLAMRVTRSPDVLPCNERVVRSRDMQV